LAQVHHWYRAPYLLLLEAAALLLLLLLPLYHYLPQ
jgi:hypothetical protein